MDSQHMRVHNLRHYVRAAGRGVSFEDHQDLLGHRSTPVTTDCSAAELEKLLHAANRITEFHKSPALTVFRRNPAELITAGPPTGSAIPDSTRRAGSNQPVL